MRSRILPCSRRTETDITESSTNFSIVYVLGTPDLWPHPTHHPTECVWALPALLAVTLHVTPSGFLVLIYNIFFIIFIFHAD